MEQRTSTDTTEFDVVVLGTGAAGLTAALAAHDGGASVAVFEKAKPGGGRSLEGLLFEMRRRKVRDERGAGQGLVGRLLKGRHAASTVASRA